MCDCAAAPGKLAGRGGGFQISRVLRDAVVVVVVLLVELIEKKEKKHPLRRCFYMDVKICRYCGLFFG